MIPTHQTPPRHSVTGHPKDLDPVASCRRRSAAPDAKNTATRPAGRKSSAKGLESRINAFPWKGKTCHAPEMSNLASAGRRPRRVLDLAPLHFPSCGCWPTGVKAAWKDRLRNASGAELLPIRLAGTRELFGGALRPEASSNAMGSSGPGRGRGSFIGRRFPEASESRTVREAKHTFTPKNPGFLPMQRMKSPNGFTHIQKTQSRASPGTGRLDPQKTTWKGVKPC